MGFSDGLKLKLLVESCVGVALLFPGCACWFLENIVGSGEAALES